MEGTKKRLKGQRGDRKSHLEGASKGNFPGPVTSALREERSSEAVEMRKGRHVRQRSSSMSALSPSRSQGGLIRFASAAIVFVT